MVDASLSQGASRGRIIEIYCDLDKKAKKEGDKVRQLATEKRTQARITKPMPRLCPGCACWRVA
jgi:hypothetical protein